MMKKSGFTLGVVILIFFTFILPLFAVADSQKNETETFIATSYSPDGKYTLTAYKTEPGATVDFSIRVYIEQDGKKEMVYNCYHEYEADIVWADNSVVIINDKMLDLSKGEKYDWRD